jgi:hypothetical protein
LPEGKIPAYDLALDFIRSRDERLAAKRKGVAEGTIPIEEGPHPTSNLKGADRYDVRIHDPEVRWKWEQGIGKYKSALFLTPQLAMRR